MCEIRDELLNIALSIQALKTSRNLWLSDQKTIREYSKAQYMNNRQSSMPLGRIGTTDTINQRAKYTPWICVFVLPVESILLHKLQFQSSTGNHPTTSLNVNIVTYCPGFDFGLCWTIFFDWRIIHWYLQTATASLACESVSLTYDHGVAGSIPGACTILNMD